MVFLNLNIQEEERVSVRLLSYTELVPYGCEDVRRFKNIPGKWFELASRIIIFFTVLIVSLKKYFLAAIGGGSGEAGSLLRPKVLQVRSREIEGINGKVCRRKKFKFRKMCTCIFFISESFFGGNSR